MGGGQDSKVRAITPRDLESAQKTTGCFFLERSFHYCRNKVGLKSGFIGVLWGVTCQTWKGKLLQIWNQLKKLAKKFFWIIFLTWFLKNSIFWNFWPDPKSLGLVGIFFSGKCKNELHILKDQRKRHRLTSVKFLKRASGLKVDITMDYQLQ